MLNKESKISLTEGYNTSTKLNNNENNNSIEYINDIKSLENKID